MRVSTAVTLALTVLLVTSLGAVATSAAATPLASQSPTADQPHALSSSTVDSQAPHSSILSASSPLEPADPRQTIRIDLGEDGDARWTIESRFLVTDDEDETLLEEYADDVAAGDRAVAYDPATFESKAALASDATDREMTIEDTGWNEPELVEPADDGVYADDDDDVQIGIISYSFTWTNFATVHDERIHVGDAFEHPDNEATWLPTLYDNQRLVIESPPNYALETATQLSWDGPHQFDSGDLEIVFVETGSSPVESWWIVAGFLAVLLAGGAYAAYRYLAGASDRDQLREKLPMPTHSSANQDAADSRSDASASTDSPSEPAPDGATDPAGTQIEFEEEPDEDIDPELLSDEERVHRLLRQNGGRMKQATIVTETGWSNAKVSQLLSQMDDDEEIEKLRIGRENLITLPEVDPTEID